VVHHVRRRCLQDLEREVHAAAEVGHEDLDARRRRQFARAPDALDEVRRAAVAQVVAVDAGDDDVRELERGDRARQVQRLVGIQRVRAAVADVAERAAPRALVEIGRASCRERVS
jgi:hypothetical protein